MYNKQLETFLKVAQTGNFSRAADALYISSSAVIQQINHLERSLGVTLFERGHYGVRLTEAGVYLAEEAKRYIQKGVQIRKNLSSISSKKDTVCVGTTVEQKVRLLYDLWVLFSGLGKQFNICLVHIASRVSLEQEVDLIESVRYGAPLWMSDWEFLKLFDVRIGCAVARHHPLASQSVIRCEDLTGWTVCSLAYSQTEGMTTGTTLPSDLSAHSVTLKEIDNYGPNLMWKCACENCALIAPMCWHDTLTDMLILPFEKEYFIPYGFFHRRELSVPVQEFLDFTAGLYSGKYPELPLPLFQTGSVLDRV